MERIALVDDLFLWLEARQQPLHVAGLQIFSLPPDAPANYIQQTAEFMRECAQPLPPFDQHIVERRFGSYWDRDTAFDINHHFRHVALPKPGGVKELLTFVSCEHSNLLDRSRPLWEVHLIEAVHGRHFALYTKIHHALMDGVSAMYLSMRCLSPDPNQRDMPPMWQTQLPVNHSQPISQSLLGSLKSRASKMGGQLGAQLGTLRPVISLLYKTYKEAQENPELANAFKAPPSRLNQPITGSRRFAAESYGRARLKKLAVRTNSTCNDIILAMCGTALRNYLRSIDSLPEQPLISMVPVSLRKEDSFGGNQVAMILANLATHKENPLERLAITKQSMEEAKETFQGMTKEQATNYTAALLAPSFIPLLTGFLPKWLAFNVVISNVPGSKQTLYWNGAKQERHYPVSAIANHMALNITIISYEDRYEFGLVGCRRTLPSMQRLLQYLEDALLELEQLLGVSSPSPKNKRRVKSKPLTGKVI